MFQTVVVVRMAQRTVLVTGASRGIGLGLVRELLQAGGCTVLATCRDPSRARDLQQVTTCFWSKELQANPGTGQ